MIDNKIMLNRLSKLKNLLHDHNLDAIIINREDEHLSEYLPEDKERLKYISGFTGSAGTLVILSNTSVEDNNQQTMALFVDGRYTLQAKSQVNPALFNVFHILKKNPEEWIKENLKSNCRVGIDPKCISFSKYTDIKNSLKGGNIELINTPYNFIDKIWVEKINQKLNPLFIFEDKYNGCPSIDKQKLISCKLQEKNIDATIISKSESVNWLLNVRGRDIPNLPIVNSFAVVYKSGHVEWFLNLKKIPKELMSDLINHIGNVNFYDESELSSLFNRLSKNNNSIYIDPRSTNAWIIDSLRTQNCELIFGQDLCELPMACKNEIEISRIKKCRIKDAVAMCKFLAWLDNLTKDIITTTKIDNENESLNKYNSSLEYVSTFNEATLSEQLTKYREELDNYIEPSFNTISAIGENASITHYNHLNYETPKALGESPMYLVDSGAHYYEGTTDITRTVLVGPGLTNEMKTCFTIVLKGLISMHRIKFPKGTFGISLDVLARAPLWQQGLNYDHGTGHGVGHCLNVHEGPQSLSQRYGQIALMEGMVTSIEPGYYKENCFGIRSENLSIVEQVNQKNGSEQMLALNPITFVPFDIRLIDKTLLTENEKNWLNNYHKQVREKVKPYLTDMEINWLLKTTAAI